MISKFYCKPEHFDKVKELIRRYPSFRFVQEPFYAFGKYSIHIEGNVLEMNAFDEIRHKMVEYNWTHKEKCMWVVPLATDYYFNATWGCTCGLDNFLIENNLE